MPVSQSEKSGPQFNSDVLQWARERMDYGLDDAARRLNVSPERVADWERGKRSPTVRQARILANFYERPFLEFLASTRPNVPDVELVPDFRFARDGTQNRERAALKAVQIWAEEQRLNAIDLFEILGEEPPHFPGELYATVEDDEEAAASRAREAVGLDLEWQSSLNSRTRNQFPNYLRKMFEGLGVLVLKQSGLQRLRARGVCLFADPLPIIIFGKEAPSAQAFTLAHELAHILLKQSAISGPPRFGGRVGSKRIESWCNRFSAAFLVPKHAIEAEFEGADRPLEQIGDDRLLALANRFAVSPHAMLIRLVTLGIVEREFYWQRKRPQFLKEEEEYKGFGIPKYYGSRYRSAHGDLYTGLVIEAWNSGRITNHNAAEFMGIKQLGHLEDIRANFET